MKKRCLIGLVGLPRTFRETAKTLKSRIIDCNHEDWTFDVAVNTDSNCMELVSRQGLGSTTARFDEEELSSICHSLYQTDHSEFVGLSFYNHTERHVSGYEVFRRRVNHVLSEFGGYDLYVFMRLDAELTEPLVLDDELLGAKIVDYLASDGSKKSESFEVLSVVTGGSRNINRMDHSRDWDYCWVGTERAVRMFIDDVPPVKDSEYDLDLLERLAEQTGIRSQYIIRSRMSGQLMEHWVEELLWRRIFRMYQERILVSFKTEEQGVFSRLVRQEPSVRQRLGAKGKSWGDWLLRRLIRHRGVEEALFSLYREVRAARAHRAGVAASREFDDAFDLKLNLGCGRDVKRGWVNVDLFHPNADIRLDFRESLPFGNGSCSHIYLKHTLECLDYPDGAHNLLQECLRLLKPGGTLDIGFVDAEWPLKEYSGAREDGYFDIALETLHPSWCSTKLEHLNFHFRQGKKRKFLYDWETLSKVLSEIGFVKVQMRDFDPEIDSGTTRVETRFVQALKAGASQPTHQKIKFASDCSV